MNRFLIVSLTASAIALAGPPQQTAIAQEAKPAPPSNLTATDHPWDNGEVLDLAWDAPAGGNADGEYFILRTVAKVGDQIVTHDFKIIDSAPGDATSIGVEVKHHLKRAAVRQLGDRIDFEAILATGEYKFTVGYLFQIVSVNADGVRSSPAQTAEIAYATMQPFDLGRLALLCVTIILCGAVIFWIRRARSGKPIKVRKIAGLEAVDEAVGRATEMGRPILYVPGIQDINEIQTIASMTILSHVSKTAAEYDAKVEVPTSKSLVMTTARETVQAAFLAAGRPDAYNKDLIYYVTDEQFGYVAYLQGMMVREKPAACFYMGAFFAESLILAETGNSIGAIQIAGTAMPAQLPFFVAACDYTLIGEEFFAASAYLSGSPEELGSLKGQDVGKVFVALVLIIGVLMATAGSMLDSPAIKEAVEYLKNTLLT
ncbi:MAG: hypothetical protein IH984_03805 [Planctomycetes bacterium]|nr:hypothetical protein [Planctomycetota bacterium]